MISNKKVKKEVKLVSIYCLQFNKNRIKFMLWTCHKILTQAFKNKDSQTDP